MDTENNQIHIFEEQILLWLMFICFQWRVILENWENSAKSSNHKIPSLASPTLPRDSALIRVLM